MTEDEMVGWHYQLDGHEFEQAPGVAKSWTRLSNCIELNGYQEDRVGGRVN